VPSVINGKNRKGKWKGIKAKEKLALLVAAPIDLEKI
jgi:hypothetical protein